MKRKSVQENTLANLESNVSLRPSASFLAEAAAVPVAVLEAQRAEPAVIQPRPVQRKRRNPSVPVLPVSNVFTTYAPEDEGSNRQAELFYLQKQIQSQTPMVLVLEDGQRVQGVIEWYDRNSIKVRGKSRVLIYKSAIKYIYKSGEPGSGTEK